MHLADGPRVHQRGHYPEDHARQASGWVHVHGRESLGVVVSERGDDGLDQGQVEVLCRAEVGPVVEDSDLAARL